MLVAKTQATVPRSSVFNKAVTINSTKESGTSNFQLKAIMWSIRMRIMVYLIHMITQ